jgi:hypothetical protein
MYQNRQNRRRSSMKNRLGLVTNPPARQHRRRAARYAEADDDAEGALSGLATRFSASPRQRGGPAQPRLRRIGGRKLAAGPVRDHALDGLDGWHDRLTTSDLARFMRTLLVGKLTAHSLLLQMKMATPGSPSGSPYSFGPK